MLRYLLNLPMFEMATPVDIFLLSKCVEVVEFSLDSPILKAGEMPKGLYIVYTGRIKLSIPMRKRFQDRNRPLSFIMSQAVMALPEGQFFGQRVLLGRHQEIYYDIIANSARVELLLITPQSLEYLFEPVKSEFLSYLKDAKEYDVKK